MTVMLVAGIDVSTRHVAISRITLDGDYVDARKITFTGSHAPDRLHDARHAYQVGGHYWDTVAHAAIEIPHTPNGRLRTGYLELMLITGLVLARIPSLIDVWTVKPHEWRRALDWPQMRRETAKARAVAYALDRTRDPAMADNDLAEAFCIAHAALAELERAAKAV